MLYIAIITLIVLVIIVRTGHVSLGMLLNIWNLTRGMVREEVEMAIEAKLRRFGWTTAVVTVGKGGCFHSHLGSMVNVDVAEIKVLLKQFKMETAMSLSEALLQTYAHECGHSTQPEPSTLRQLEIFSGVSSRTASETECMEVDAWHRAMQFTVVNETFARACLDSYGITTKL